MILEHQRNLKELQPALDLPHHRPVFLGFSQRATFLRRDFPPTRWTLFGSLALHGQQSALVLDQSVTVDVYVERVFIAIPCRIFISIAPKDNSDVLIAGLESGGELACVDAYIHSICVAGPESIIEYFQ